MEPFIGQIQAFGFNFAPRGWAKCDGQLLPISQNSALFSLLGTTYGGDGRTTFALPDLRGRTMLSEGTGPGLSTRQLGQRGGTETNTLNVTQLPSHNHALGAGSSVSIPVSGEDADQDEAAGKFLANGTFYHNQADGVYGNGPIPLSGTTLNQGGQQAFNNMQPYLVVNICIALVGLFPSRN
jgi:microcystin-dependent protein